MRRVRPGRESGRVGQLRHGDVEIHHDTEYDFLTASTTLSVTGQVPERFAELLAAEPADFPRSPTDDRYEEAAIVDGAGRWDVIREEILPLSKPGIAVVLVFTFLAGWNEFIVARTLLRPENYTLSVELYSLATAGRYETPWTEFSAFALLFALPVAIIYFFAQSYVESDLSFGGMDG